MCGICGFTGAELSDLPVLKDMCDALAHRGPDGEGRFVVDGVALGHRRLALVDIEGGSQPLVRSRNGLFAIVFNGEIYNHRELRDQLARLGWSFQTSCDTEVLLTAYMEWGADCLEKLRGMFAFAIWDGRRRRLFCARDPFGIKPLYYAQRGSRFIFASEIKSILRHPAYQRQLNEEALAQYLCFQFSALPETFFKGVFKLPAAHWLTVEADGRVQLRRYWRPAFEPDRRISEGEAAEMIDAAVRDSVHAHAQADAPVGSLLSGGVDSSYLAACLGQEAPATRTFTVGFGEHEGFADERACADELAQSIGVANEASAVSERAYWGSVGRVLWHMDEPTGDPAAVALLFADALAATQVKAVMSGEGADELFGGYRVYQAPLAARRLALVPSGLLRRGASAARRFGIRGANYLDRAACRPKDWYYTNANQLAFSAAERDELLGRPAASPQELVAPLYSQGAHLSDPTQMQLVDLSLWLVEDILQKTDKMSMACSLEARVPFLDTRVFEAARVLPDGLRLDRVHTKKALRAAAARALPQRFAHRQKLGFPVPLCAWLRGDARQDQMRSLFTSSTARMFFDTGRLCALLDEHRTGYDRTRRIWLICSFLVWYRIYFDRRTVPAARNLWHSVSQVA